MGRATMCSRPAGHSCRHAALCLTCLDQRCCGGDQCFRYGCGGHAAAGLPRLFVRYKRRFSAVAGLVGAACKAPYAKDVSATTIWQT